MTLDAPREVGIGTSVAQVYDYGAHVWSWSLDGDAVLWTSAKSVFETGKALRGGVPICWPWFGPGRTGDLTPAHGFARISEWTLAGRVDRANAESSRTSSTPKRRLRRCRARTGGSRTR